MLSNSTSAGIAAAALPLEAADRRVSTPIVILRKVDARSGTEGKKSKHATNNQLFQTQQLKYMRGEP